MNVPAQTVQFEITDLQPTFLDYIQSQKDENTRTFNIQFLFEGDVLSLSGCTATATVTINNIMVEQELACEVNETNNYVTVVVNAPYSGVMAVQVTLADGTNTLTMPRPLFVRVARDIAETAQIDDNTHGSFAEVVREVADARGNYATLAQAINAKMDADDATVYHVDTTTQTLTYDNTNPKTIYLNARVSYGSVSNRAAIVISTSSKGYQFAITVTGDILMRSGGGTYPTDWTVLYGSSYKKNSINDDNKNSSVFIPTIGAVVSYLVANYIGNGSGTVTENNLTTALKNSLYRVDNTTENVIYSADNPRIIYTNARVNGNKPTLIFTLGDDSQLAMHKDGNLYCRTYANGAYGSWIDLKAMSIGESNKTSGAYPTVQAVYNFVTAFVASAISGKANAADVNTALDGKENLSNKVPNRAAMDNLNSETQYPSIKTMVQYTDEKVLGVIDNTLSTQGAAADAKATGDAVSALNKEINELDDYVMPNTILDFEDNISILSGLTVSSVSKTRLVATSGSNAIADYIPITLIANKEYLFYFDFSTTDGENVNIRFYGNDKSTLIKAYSTNKEMYHYTPSSSSTIYLRLYFLNADSTLTVKDSFVGLYSEYGNLIGKIGNPQLTADMQSLISNLTKKTYNHESELNVLNDYVLPTNLIDFESNKSALSGLAIQKISKTTLKASRPSNDASAEYWIPISVQSGAYKFKFTFTSEDGANLNIRLFDTNKSTQLKAFSTSNKVEEFTFTESKTVYIRLYFLSLNKVLDITDSIIAPSAVFNEYLSQKIGYKQLADDLSQYWVKIEDKFDITVKARASGVTDSKDGNEISLTTTADSSYIIYDLTCDENKKYVLYYDLTGTYTGGNYSFQVRLLSTSFTSFIETISQTSGASASGTILINPGTGDGGKFSINMPNVNGQSISGDLYIYDVTNLSQEQIDSVDWENVGESALIFTGSSGGSLSNSWSGKKVVFYGDSITQTSYPEKVQAKLGFTLVKNAYGGSRFGYASSANAFSDDTRISELPTDADVVCIMGGTNDWQHTEIETTALAYNDGFDRTKLKGAIAYTVQKIQARCTSARVYLLTNIGGRGNSDPTVIQPLPQVAPSGAGAGNTPLMVRNAMIEVAEELNIPVIDTWSCGINGFNRGTYIADTVHPTNAGQIVIAEYIVNALMNDAPW